MDGIAYTCNYVIQILSISYGDLLDSHAEGKHSSAGSECTPKPAKVYSLEPVNINQSSSSLATNRIDNQ